MSVEIRAMRTFQDIPSRLKAEVVRLLEHNHSVAAIEACTGLSRWFIRRILDEAGYSHNQRRR